MVQTCLFFGVCDCVFAAIALAEMPYEREIRTVTQWTVEPLLDWTSAGTYCWLFVGIIFKPTSPLWYILLLFTVYPTLAAGFDPGQSDTGFWPESRGGFFLKHPPGAPCGQPWWINHGAVRIQFGLEVRTSMFFFHLMVFFVVQHVIHSP